MGNFCIALAGCLLFWAYASITSPPAYAAGCKKHQLAEVKNEKGQLKTECVSVCDPGEIYVAISTDGQTNCIKEGASFEQNPIYTWLIAMLRFLSAGVGIAVVGGIAWGGILYATSRDNASQTQRAIAIVVNSVIGLLLYIFMFAIVNFLVPGGILQ